MAGDPYTGSLIVVNVPKLHTHSLSEPRFRALLAEGI